METLLMREQQLQELLAREAELSPAQREELLRQLAAWPQPAPAAVCSEETEDCRGRMVVVEPDLPVVSADRRHDFKLVSPGLARDTWRCWHAAPGTLITRHERESSPPLASPDIISWSPLDHAHTAHLHHTRSFHPNGNMNVQCMCSKVKLQCYGYNFTQIRNSNAMFFLNEENGNCFDSQHCIVCICSYATSSGSWVSTYQECLFSLKWIPPKLETFITHSYISILDTC